MTDPQPVPELDLDRPCPHEHFESIVEVVRLTDGEGTEVNAFTASILIACGQCGERFRFRGVACGFDPRKPMCSVDELELRVPIRPASSDPDFGLGIPGFSIRMREGE